MGIGIRNIFRQVADQPVISSVVPVSITNLQFPIGANQKVKLKAWILVNEVNAAPGVRFILLVPAGANSNVHESIEVVNTSTKVLDAAQADNSTPAVPVVATAALANIGTHIAKIEADYINGPTAGTIAIQFAQSVSSANNTTVLAGSTLEVTYE